MDSTMSEMSHREEVIRSETGACECSHGPLSEVCIARLTSNPCRCPSVFPGSELLPGINTGEPASAGVEQPRRSSQPCVGVVMPAYNEEGTIDRIVGRVLARPEVVQLVIVDDGSCDGTWDRMADLAAQDVRVIALRHSKNRGKGAAIRTGMAALCTTYLIIQDADLEYDPGDFQKVLAPLLAGDADVVYGSRFIEASLAFSHPLHRLGNRCLSWAASWVTGLELSDEATCYKAMRVDFARSLCLSEDGFGFCSEVTAKIARRGVRLIQIPISYTARSVAEGKKIRLWHGIKALWCLVLYSFWDSSSVCGRNGAKSGWRGVLKCLA